MPKSPSEVGPHSPEASPGSLSAFILSAAGASTSRATSSIGRSTLYRYVVRSRAVCGLDDSLLLLMARERITSQRRVREIALAEKAFGQEMGRAVPTSPAGKDSK